MINVFGLVGNTLVLLCVFKSPKLKSITFKLFGYLAVVGFLSTLQHVLTKILLHFKFSLAGSFIYITTTFYAISLAYMVVAISYHYCVGFKSTE